MEPQFFIFGLFLLGIIEAVTVDKKSSLTFVIDDTGSMQVDVHELNKTAKSIFDKVNSNASHIDDFIVVTFNDPEVKLRNNEHSKSDFEAALSNIEARGGGNCAEMSLSGMELGLEKSRAGSLLWVFTDASAADMDKYYKVEELSQKMGSQVYFAVTGLCDNRTNPDFLVYRELAIATNGQVFHLRKNQIGQIFKYVELLIEDRKDIVTSKTFPAGGLNQIDVNVDADMDELIIAVSGENPVVTVSNSSGALATTDVTRLGEIAVVTVAVDSGVYKVEVTSNSETHVVVAASTSVHFEHGFSVFSSSNINGTTRKPVPGTQSHLSIQLANESPEEFDVRSVQILDMDDKVILEEPLELVNKVTQFYTTKKITPPDHMFKVAVKMYDASHKTYITRHGLTPIKPQNKTRGDTTEKAPIVSIVGGPNINAAYYHPLQLRCKIKGYPTPNVSWKSSDMSANLTYDKHVSIFELPDDYISVLDIYEVKNNATYTCSAMNTVDIKEATVSVQTQVIIVSTPIELPQNATIEYLKAGRIACKVETFPVGKVSWFKNGKPLRPDGNLEVSKDGSVLNIRSMEPYMADSYNCLVENALLKNVYPFKLSISGLEPPTIKTQGNINVMKNSKVDLKCSVTAGIPEPSIRWFYKDNATSEFTALNKNTDTIHFDSVDVTSAGTYFCLAENFAGSAKIQFELNVNEKCKMPQDKGPCRAALSKWYYDSDLKECRSFLFGGCRGNENNFDTEEACRSECATPVIVTTTPEPILDKCQMPKDSGPCLASHTRWYYDSHLRACRQFKYGGCRGNKNNFDSEAACRAECPTPLVTTPAPLAKCEQPMEVGKCQAAFEKWYYDSGLKACRMFIYGGCHGNENNFDSEAACRAECPTPPVTTPVPLDKCQMPKDSGPCHASHTRWYYDSHLKACHQFKYGGCRGNENNFDSEAACRAECPTPLVTTPAPLAKCEQPMEVGNCQAAFEKWYYDSGLKACRMFIYGGCHGNENNFDSEAACRAECPTPPVTTPVPIAKCEQPMEVGNCQAAFQKWYYDSGLKACRMFIYGGCHGNENNFDSEAACRAECPTPPVTTPAPIAKCEQPMEVGNCQAAFQKWYYDSGLKACRRFIYGGCHGNENNFGSEADCRAECAPVTTPAPLGKCEQPMEAGRCQGAFQKWFYDSGLKACRRFIYGGCNGNQNNFNSEAACRAECASPVVVTTHQAPLYEHETQSDTMEPPTSIGCILDIKRDLNGKDPLMLTQNDEFTNFGTSEGFLEIPVNQTIKLVCPGKFNKLFLKEIIVTCKSEKQFLHQGRPYAYSELKCNDQWQYKNIKTGRQCLTSDSELLNVGFEIRGRFQEIYQVCLNRITNNPIYVKHNLVQALPNAVSNKDTPWFDNEDSVDLDVTFDCGTQNEEISRTLNKEFHKDGCCFAKRMLVNPLDVAPGPAQDATYSYLNIAPHWSSCNSQNWEEVEQRIRGLRKKSGRPLQVWTGVAEHLQIADASSELQNITLSHSGKEFQVPKYLWKVVQDPLTKASLAIIQVNIPDLKSNPRQHILCTDVCRKTTWVQSSRFWRTLSRGLTYCCELEAFKRSFKLVHYGGLPTSSGLLLDATPPSALPNIVV